MTPTLASKTRPLTRRRPIPAPSRNEPDRARAPLGLLGALAIILLVESSLARSGTDLLDPVAYSWRYAAGAAVTQAPRSDILLMGDSLAKHALVPSLIDRATGLRSANLAVAAGPAPITEALLQRSLDAGAHPRAVVFDLKPGLLAGGPRFSIRSFSQTLTAPEALGLARAERSGSFATELLLGRLLPSYRSRHEIQGLLTALFAGQPNPWHGFNTLLRRNWTTNGGVNLATPHAVPIGPVTEAQHREYLSQGFRAHRVNAEYARRLVALAARDGCRPYLLLPPVAPDLQSRRDQSGADAKYLAFLQALQAREPRLTLVDARHSGYPASVFVDPVHLDARGTVALSTDLADALARDLASQPREAARRIVLPPYQARPIPPGLEDVEQSRAQLSRRP